MSVRRAPWGCLHVRMLKARQEERSWRPGAAIDESASYDHSFVCAKPLTRERLHDELVLVRIITTDGHDLGHCPAAVDARQVHNQVDGERDCLTGASMRQSDV